MTSHPIGREPVQLVEILQPLCQNVFGVSPCTASGTADTKCYNTRATCQDTSNYSLGTPLSLWFASAQVLPTLQDNQRVNLHTPIDWIVADGVWNDGGKWYDSEHWRDSKNRTISPDFDPVNTTYPTYIFPALMSVSTSPTRANLSGASGDASGLGNRAVCTIRFKDFQHTDRLVDPYIDGRSWNPLDASRGSFWARWLVRNRYRTNIQVKVYEGYAGQDLSDMTVRLYFVTGISKQNSAGEITMQCKDILTRIEQRQAQVPALSSGVLFEDLSATANTFIVKDASLSDYDAAGTVRIGDEVLTYTARATVTDGIEFTGATRGTDGTTADSHNADAVVQRCIRYDKASITDTLVDLLETKGGIPSTFMTDLKTGGSSFDELVSFLSTVEMTRLLTKPYAIADLVAEIAEQLQIVIWWEETEQLIKARVIKGSVGDQAVLTEENHILSGSFSMSDLPKQRVSQIWVTYGLRDPTGDEKDYKNYDGTRIQANLESETDLLYGAPSIRRIFGTWITQTPVANNTATRITRRYNELPTQAEFRVDIKDGGYQIGDTFKISHHLDVDQYGQRVERTWMVSSREEVVPNEIVRYTVEDTTLYGKVYFVMPTGSADYDPVTKPAGSYIGDANGLLSDGTNAARTA